MEDVEDINRLNFYTKMLKISINLTPNSVIVNRDARKQKIQNIKYSNSQKRHHLCTHTHTINQLAAWAFKAFLEYKYIN